MILAAVDDGFYNFLLLVHLFLVIIGVGAAFAIPVMAVQLKRLQGTSLTQALKAAYDSARFLIVPSIAIAGLVGPFLVLASDDVIEMSDTWISLGFLLWLVAIAIGIGVQWPNERKKVEIAKALEDEGADTAALSAQLDSLYGKAAMWGGINHLIFLGLLIVMIWKPGA